VVNSRHGQTVIGDPPRAATRFVPPPPTSQTPEPASAISLSASELAIAVMPKSSLLLKHATGLQDSQRSEDILQEVFLATLVAMRRYGDEWEIKDLEGWIYNTTKYRSVVNAHLRQLHWSRFSAVEEVVGIEELHSSWDDPDRVVTALDAPQGVSERGTRVGRLVEMRVLGYSTAEIAESTGYAETSVRKIWSRALAKLRSTP
jgi:DNA-directed RNA polymerase specialized sigma24 family protein